MKIIKKMISLAMALIILFSSLNIVNANSENVSNIITENTSDELEKQLNDELEFLKLELTDQDKMEHYEIHKKIIIDKYNNLKASKDTRMVSYAVPKERTFIIGLPKGGIVSYSRDLGMDKITYGTAYKGQFLTKNQVKEFISRFYINKGNTDSSTFLKFLAVTGLGAISPHAAALFTVIEGANITRDYLTRKGFSQAYNFNTHQATSGLEISQVITPRVGTSTHISKWGGANYDPANICKISHYENVKNLKYTKSK